MVHLKGSTIFSLLYYVLYTCAAYIQLYGIRMKCVTHAQSES